MLFEKTVIEKYRQRLHHRRDNPQGIFYFSPEDFPGLQAHPYCFTSQKGHMLKGYFYCYPDPVPGRLVVFDHGMGNGHRAYITEIEVLAKAGFLVFSYDHTGCMESEGKGMGGFAQSLCDLDDCLTALKAEPQLQNRTISVIGHSWGSYSVMNIAAFHPDVAHIIGISGFISVKQIVRQSFSGVLRFYRKTIVAQELLEHPKYAGCCAADTLSHTDVPVLLIHSEDDPVVHAKHHFAVLQKALAQKPNVGFLPLSGKRHNPHYTEDAVICKDAFFAQLQSKLKDGSLSTPEQKQAFMKEFDWHRMCRQDETVWKIILDTLAK